MSKVDLIIVEFPRQEMHYVRAWGCRIHMHGKNTRAFFAGVPGKWSR